MTDQDSPSPKTLLVERDVVLTLVELCQVCRVTEQEIRAWVIEGVLDPAGHGPEDWRFAGPSLWRARTAYRLSRDLEINLAGIALALNLLDEISALKSRLEGARPPHDPSSTILVE